MDYTQIIGQNIAKLRREKQVKQDELANYAGVSAQAVSKWENGGMPDAYLLPKIADFFGVSVDALFGRNPVRTGSLWDSLRESVADDSDLTEAFKVCNLLRLAIDSDDEDKPEPLVIEKGVTESIHIQRRCGFARILLTEDIPYFLLMPDFSEKKGELFAAAGLSDLFRDLADEKFFEAVVYLMNRESDKAFTSNLLRKNLGFSEDELASVIAKLKHYSFLSCTTVELDEEETIMYKTQLPASFAAMIRFARELPMPKA